MKLTKDDKALKGKDMKEELKVNFGIDHKFVSKETEKEIFDFIKEKINVPEHLIGLTLTMSVNKPMVVTYVVYPTEKETNG